MLLTGASQADKKAPSFKVPTLRNIDKVELLDIKTEKGSIITGVVANKVLEGKDVSTIVELWRKQKISPYSPSACHNPPYAIKFYSTEKLVVYASICWSCNDISFIVPKAPYWSGFEAETAAAKELRKVFEEAFHKKKEG